MADVDGGEPAAIQQAGGRQGGNSEVVATDYNTYEDYLDSQITPTDLYYLEDKELARQLVELGYRGTGEPLKREEFESRKKAAESARSPAKRFVGVAAALDQRAGSAQPRARGMVGDVGVVSGEEQDAETSVVITPFLQALRMSLSEGWISVLGVTQHFPIRLPLVDREEANRSGKMTTILFIRDRNAKNQEISGYIDLAHRLKNEQLDDYLDSSKRMLPKTSDLSFYNWETHACVANATPNFQVVADDAQGLLFKNKRDRKVISVDPRQDGKAAETCLRTEVKSPEYVQCVFYDHVIRRKM